MLSLSNILKLNSISSGATGLILVLFAKTIAHIFGVVDTLPIILVGVFLVLFALFVFQVSIGKPLNSKAVTAVIGLDSAWVVVSAIALVFFIPVLTVIGNVMVAAVALWVAAMAFLQWRGLREELQNQKM